MVGYLVPQLRIPSVEIFWANRCHPCGNTCLCGSTCEQLLPTIYCDMMHTRLALDRPSGVLHTTFTQSVILECCYIEEFDSYLTLVPVQVSLTW